MQKLRVVQETRSWIIVDKPSHFHSHPPENKEIRMNPRWNALGILERQLDQKLFPMHRLDRAASGLLLFSRDRSINHSIQRQFEENAVEKTYYVVARGEVKGKLNLAAPLKSESGALQPCYTLAEACFAFELPIVHPRGGNRVFTSLEVKLGTGRFHQIRRHFASAGFPIVGDSRHGDRKLNREFAAVTGCSHLLLRCMELRFKCPVSGNPVTARARWNRDWHRLFDKAGACVLMPPTSSLCRELP